MLSNLKKYNVILASNSPRRKELLSGLGVKFTVKTLGDIDESYPDTLDGEEIPKHIANKKADAYAKTINDNELIITADTIVLLRDDDGKGRVLGKPHDEQQATDMLADLSGRTHEVITGVCLLTKNLRRVFAVTSKVSFDNLSDEDIRYYVTHFHPLDKAGAYGIQEWIGYIGVNGLVGSYFNVMGLPVQRLYKELQKI